MPGGPEQPVLGGVEHKIGGVAPLFSTLGFIQTEIDPPFIGSVTVVYAPPDIPEVVVPFVASATAMYAPSVVYTGAVPLLTVQGTYSWLCPAGITSVTGEAIGGGGGGSTSGGNSSGAGGGGGAYAKRVSIPVTPGTLYTFVVGAGGTTNAGSNGGFDGADSSFTGDSGVQVIAKAGKAPTSGATHTHGAGGLASASTGDTKFNGGDGGDGINDAAQGGAGGGASGNRTTDGNAGSSSDGTTIAVAGGAGANIGGSGGHGGDYSSGNHLTAGSAPGGGGGGSGGFGIGASGGDGGVIITPALVLTKTQTAKVRVQRTLTRAQTARARITRTVTKAQASVARVSKSVPKAQTARARVQRTSLTKVQTSVARVQVTGTKAQTATARLTASSTKTQTATAHVQAVAEVDVPFVPSRTVVYGVWSLFDPNRTFSGPGNGGETFGTRLNASGTTTTATLASGVGLTGTGGLTMTGDSGMPPTGVSFVATIDSEQILLVAQGAGAYLLRQRGMGNTTIAVHSPGASVSWGDTYDMAIVSNVYLNTDFTADIEGTGSSLYTGWLMAFDSSQGYESDGTRYPMHIAELTGVFAAGAGVTGPSKTDGPQPSAIHAPDAASDHCGAALTVPALITTNIVPGDVVVLRYTNPEAFTLDLGPRSGAIQSWYGLKRVDTSDNDVTYTDPNGIVVDTKSGYGTYTGSVNVEPDEPLALAAGIAKDSSDAAGHAIPTAGPVPWLTTTLPGTDRYFTDGVHYSERGWPVGVLSVRQGNRRVPFWQSWDWHDFNYVYSGFGTDDSFAQVVINRNGMSGVLPTINLPGSQDIDGPDAYWDDGTYYFGASWYVLLVATPYLVGGQVITFPPGQFVPGPPPPPGTIPVVVFPGGGGGTVTPPTVEGGSGGNISPTSTGLNVWQIF